MNMKIPHLMLQMACKKIAYDIADSRIMETEKVIFFHSHKTNIKWQPHFSKRQVEKRITDKSNYFFTIGKRFLSYLCPLFQIFLTFAIFAIFAIFATFAYSFFIF
jgi:hypothetical protein